MTDLDRWKKAVIHLEGAVDSVSLDERFAAYRAMAEAAENMSDRSAAADLLTQGSRDIRYRGTAVFVEGDDGDHYLLTARHVICESGDDRPFQLIFPFQTSTNCSLAAERSSGEGRSSS